MNQDNLDFFLMFAEHHKVNLCSMRTISTYRPVGIEFCKDQPCGTCVHRPNNSNATSCHRSIITDDEVEFLKLSYPEYFL